MRIGLSNHYNGNLRNMVIAFAQRVSMNAKPLAPVSGRAYTCDTVFLLRLRLQEIVNATPPINLRASISYRESALPRGESFPRRPRFPTLILAQTRYQRAVRLPQDLLLVLARSALSGAPCNQCSSVLPTYNYSKYVLRGQWVEHEEQECRGGAVWYAFQGA
jgi:hypothetical protein